MSLENSRQKSLEVIKRSAGIRDKIGFVAKAIGRRLERDPTIKFKI